MTTMPTPAQIRLAFPQFADRKDPELNSAITFATPYFEDPDRYGDFLVSAQNYCTAYFLVENNAERGMDRGTNDTTSETRTTLKANRDAKLLQGQAVDPFMRNQYGQMFRDLQRRAGLGGVAAVLPPGPCVLPDQLWSG